MTSTDHLSTNTDHLSTRIAFEAYGEPVAQGSLRAFVRDGRAVVTYGPRALSLGVWRGLIGAAALEAMGERDPLPGPVVVSVGLTFCRPAAHIGARGVLPRYRDRIPGPDIDKLCRAVLDALTGIAYLDDRQVRDLIGSKRYGERAGVAVTIDELEPAAPMT